VFSPGDILYFNPFYFKNGNTAKNKYFIVLKKVDGELVIASLPTRTDRVPRHITVEHGCLNDQEGCFNCYHFAAEQIICENGFCFPLNTFLYVDEVDYYNLESLSDQYINGIDYETVGKLKNAEFEELIECLRISTSIKRKIRRYLFS
jgi:hypothetical protein